MVKRNNNAVHIEYPAGTLVKIKLQKELKDENIDAEDCITIDDFPDGKTYCYGIITSILRVSLRGSTDRRENIYYLVDIYDKETTNATKK